MNATDTKIAEVNLLLANAETYIQQPHRDFLEESKLTILWNWVTSVKSGKVERLTLRQFNFYPTEWFVVLDEEVVIFGHYLLR